MADFVFTPDMLNPGVFVRDQFGFIVSGVRDSYCATIGGATSLQEYLAAAGIQTTIVMDWPLWPQQGDGPFGQSTRVPWLVDGKGAKENAGLLLDNYRVLPYSLADATVKGSFKLDDTVSA